jgi:serine phosphatase RsbU (regulator of sigma subunit)/anti-sigma regulatory factor (Ser/Thr protein kinase)
MTTMQRVTDEKLQSAPPGDGTVQRSLPRSGEVHADQEQRETAELTELAGRALDATGGTSQDAILTPQIADNDPIIAYLQGASGAVDLTHLDLDSPALRELREQGVVLVVPLVTSGELVGILNVGPRLSEQGYSNDDRRLLESLAAHAAPALRVGQLIREQQAEMRERGRMEQELQVAQMIQQNFLPRELPRLAGWELAADYRPARAVGGDFYDFIELEDGKVGIVIGDVTDKGIPAAMVMAATKSLLRASAQRLVEPGDVLARVNDQLCPEIPENMFVTCFYGVLDPANGELRFANAGHNLPLVYTGDRASELRATGMPLGLMPEMSYDVCSATIARGARVLFYSDGLIEAHDSAREMFGTARAADVLAGEAPASDVLERLLDSLDAFTLAGGEQEDDITLVALVRSAETAARPAGQPAVLADFTVASAPGNERGVVERLAEVLASSGLDVARLERLKTATAEATMNAMEHGNRYDPALDVRIVVAATPAHAVVRIYDHGTAEGVEAAEQPDIEAKLEGLQAPRGWGLFLIREMVDEVEHRTEDGHHVLELVMNIEGGDDAAGDA